MRRSICTVSQKSLSKRARVAALVQKSAEYWSLFGAMPSFP